MAIIMPPVAGSFSIKNHNISRGWIWCEGGEGVFLQTVEKKKIWRLYKFQHETIKIQTILNYDQSDIWPLMDQLLCSPCVFCCYQISNGLWVKCRIPYLCKYNHKINMPTILDAMTYTAYFTDPFIFIIYIIQRINITKQGNHILMTSRQAHDASEG